LAYTPHRGQQVIAPREFGIAGDDLSHPFVEQKDIGLEPSQATFIEALQHGVLDVGGLVFSSLGVGELIATAAVVLLLIAVQGLFIAKHPLTLNAAAKPAPFGIIAP
jgi:hypothetical protein